MFGRALDEDGEGCLAHEPRRTGVSIEIAVHVTRPMNGAGYAGERNPMNQGREIFVESLCLGRIAPQPAEVSLLRSEEHTSELQSLMRNSYAVFCLKQKK